jgi:ankyrin repeat protein
MTKKLLEWNEGLIKQGDESSGSTPLHFAASWRFESMLENLLRRDSITSITAKLLLDAYESSAYQADHNGSFPIHVAALTNNIAVARVLLQKCPDCVHLRDAQGRTFLHIAAFKGYTYIVMWVHFFFLRRGNRVHFFFLRRGNRNDGRPVLASIMNMQDNEGNTALHLAAMAGQLWTIRRLVWYEEVQLNLQNNKGKTAHDLAESRRPPWVLSMLVRNLFMYTT